MMVPQPVNAGSERGYYIFFDPKSWTRERVGFDALIGSSFEGRELMGSILAGIFVNVF